LKYAIISDIHGNLAALEASLSFIDKEKCDHIICLGDIVGYGPYPNECIKLIRQSADVVLAGNHDHAAVDLLTTSYFNKYAKLAAQWTKNVITADNWRYIAGLPYEKVIHDSMYVHASPRNPEEWDYVLSVYDARENFSHFNERICFIGHSHVPVNYALQQNDQINVLQEPKLKLVDSARYIVNIGSVGQPRDGNPHASFGIYLPDENLYELKRVSYNIQATQEAMRMNNLPHFLIERLAKGR